jgi:RNA polymerase sigma-70 factor, ECF subfamily
MTGIASPLDQSAPVATSNDSGSGGSANSLHDAVEARALEALDRGDVRAVLTLLMDTYGDGIYRFCHQFSGDAQLAEDLRQVVFMQAFEALPSFSQRASLRAWLYTIARNRCLDAVKGRRRWRKRFHLDDAPAERAITPAPDPADLDQPLLHRALTDCLGRLDAELRMLVLMRYREELSYTELAQTFAAQPATLQARVARTMSKLRRCLHAQGVSS